MSDDIRDNFNFSDGDLQSLLLHASHAEEAGVFEKTPVDADAIMTETRGRGGRLGVVRIAAPLAACVALWFGWVALDPGSLREGVPAGGAIANSGIGVVDGGSDCVSLAVLNSCLTGPGASVLSRDCACADLDRDGDVDFADFGRFQQTVNPLRG